MITLKFISKHPPLYLPTLKFHLKQEQQNIRSTKPLPKKYKIEEESSHNQESKTQDYFLTLLTKEYGTTYSDITDRYPIIYSRDNQYIVIYNSIQVIPTKTQNAEEI